MYCHSTDFGPQERLDEVIEDLGDALGRTIVGDPALKQVRMGPLSTAAQVKSAHEGIQALRSEADIVFGQIDASDLEGVLERTRMLCYADAAESSRCRFWTSDSRR